MTRQAIQSFDLSYAKQFLWVDDNPAYPIPPPKINHLLGLDAKETARQFAQMDKKITASFKSDQAAEIHQHLHSHVPADAALRVKALESLAVEHGLVASETIDAWVEAYSEHIGPKRGAAVIARSWCDPDFAIRLAEDAGSAIKEFGFEGNATGHLKAVFNTSETHNLVVCTLCSCYPFSILGMSPAWYKSAAYRSRAVREPRAVLQEFGVTIADDVAVRVWDSTAELRYIVIPERPPGSEHKSEAELAELVSRNSMIGTERDL